MPTPPHQPQPQLGFAGGIAHLDTAADAVLRLFESLFTPNTWSDKFKDNNDNDDNDDKSV